LAFGASGSVSRKLLPTPLPELAERYARLVADVAKETPLLIGIDGLDEHDPGTDIEQILFELQPFLTTVGCRYLIAVTEDYGPRTAFRRSIIDDIVYCERLTVDDAQSFLQTRIIGLPIPFAYLCFAVSGGLPGEMLRAVNLTLDMSHQSSLSLASACLTMVGAELRALSGELRWAARGLPSWTRQQQLFDWAEELTASPPVADSILEVAANVRALAIDQPDAARRDEPIVCRVTHRAAVLAYFCATLIEFFTDTEISKRASAPDVVIASLGRLADARQLIRNNAYGPAWTDVSAFRVEWEMQVVAGTDNSAWLGKSEFGP